MDWVRLLIIFLKIKNRKVFKILRFWFGLSIPQKIPINFTFSSLNCSIFLERNAKNCILLTIPGKKLQIFGQEINLLAQCATWYVLKRTTHKRWSTHKQVITLYLRQPKLKKLFSPFVEKLISDWKQKPGLNIISIH